MGCKSGTKQTKEEILLNSLLCKHFFISATYCTCLRCRKRMISCTCLTLALGVCTESLTSYVFTFHTQKKKGPKYWIVMGVENAGGHPFLGEMAEKTISLEGGRLSLPFAKCISKKLFVTFTLMPPFRCILSSGKVEGTWNEDHRARRWHDGVHYKCTV
jgi:hypothetical protein